MDGGVVIIGLGVFFGLLCMTIGAGVVGGISFGVGSGDGVAAGNVGVGGDRTLLMLASAVHRIHLQIISIYAKHDGGRSAYRLALRRQCLSNVKTASFDDGGGSRLLSAFSKSAGKVNKPSGWSRCSTTKRL